MSAREEAVFLAKLSEQAERYDGEGWDVLHCIGCTHTGASLLCACRRGEVCVCAFLSLCVWVCFLRMHACINFPPVAATVLCEAHAHPQTLFFVLVPRPPLYVSSFFLVATFFTPLSRLVCLAALEKCGSPSHDKDSSIVVVWLPARASSSCPAAPSPSLLSL